jgi:hypothetical protein
MVLCASSITETVAAVSKIYCPHEMKLPGRYRGLSTTLEVVERGVRPIVTLRHATSVSVHAGTFPNLMLMQTCVDGAGTIRQGDVKASDAYNAACLAGLGLIQAPELGVREHLARGVLVEALPRYRPEPMSLSLLYAHRRNLPKRVRVFHGLGRCDSAAGTRPLRRPLRLHLLTSPPMIGVGHTLLARLRRMVRKTRHPQSGGRVA